MLVLLVLLRFTAPLAADYIVVAVVVVTVVAIFLDAAVFFSVDDDPSVVFVVVIVVTSTGDLEDMFPGRVACLLACLFVVLSLIDIMRKLPLYPIFLKLKHREESRWEHPKKISDAKVSIKAGRVNDSQHPRGKSALASRSCEHFQRFLKTVERWSGPDHDFLSVSAKRVRPFLIKSSKKWLTEWWWPSPR